MFEVKDLRQKRKAVIRRSIVDGFLALLFLFGLIFSTGWLSERFSLPDWIIPIGILSTVPLIYLLFALRHRRLGLNCPACKTRLDDQNIRIAIASKNCAFCGEKIVVD
jgi:hypothetical protein